MATPQCSCCSVCTDLYMSAADGVAYVLYPPVCHSHSHEMSAELLGQIKQLLLSQHRGQTSKSFIYNTHAVGILLINMHSVFRLLTPVNQHHPLGYVIYNIIGLLLMATMSFTAAVHNMKKNFFFHTLKTTISG